MTLSAPVVELTGRCAVLALRVLLAKGRQACKQAQPAHCLDRHVTRNAIAAILGHIVHFDVRYSMVSELSDNSMPMLRCRSPASTVAALPRCRSNWSCLLLTVSRQYDSMFHVESNGE
jgi:hypothetical protein